MKSLAGSVLVVVLAAGCSSPASPTSRSLSGAVTESPGGAVANATIRITDGPNAGAATKTDASGFYRFNGLTSGATMHVSASVGYGDSVKEFTLSNGVNRLDFHFEAPVFFASGVGNGTIQVPARVTKAHVKATYTGPCAVFGMTSAVTTVGILGEYLGASGLCPAWEEFEPWLIQYDRVHDLKAPVGTLNVTAGPTASWSFEEVR